MYALPRRFVTFRPEIGGFGGASFCRVESRARTHTHAHTTPVQMGRVFFRLRPDTDVCTQYTATG